MVTMAGREQHERLLIGTSLGASLHTSLVSPFFPSNLAPTHKVRIHVLQLSGNF